MTTTDIINARKGKKVRDLEAIQAVANIQEIVSNCHLARGSKSTAEDNITTARVVYQQLMKDFPTITLEELQLASNEALFSGVKTYGVSPVEMIKWLKDYGASDEYKQARWEEDRIAPQYQIETPKRDITDAQAAKEILRKDYDVMYNNEPLGFRFSYPRGTFVYDYLIETRQLGEKDWQANLSRGKEAIRKAERQKVFEQLSVTDDPVIMAKAITVDDYLRQLVARKRAALLAQDDLPD